jgi:alkanesulfonate monooxygenase SsuD/methylene tetrahydromethanopterin reductase-like flavin-dependent oxidoreductase (luciferase family)
MQISVMLETQSGLNWDGWKYAVARADDWGLAGLYTSDHWCAPIPFNNDSLEMIVALTYLAANTKRVTFGPMVSPMTFRHPALLARQATMLNELSGGRMIIGVGAGWMEREHRMFGFDLGDVPTRMARFAEGVAVIHKLTHTDGLCNFDGKFFQLRDAFIKPRTMSTRIQVGGNGEKKTLRLAAQFAEQWNGVHLAPETFRERSALLDTYAREFGRDPKSIKRTHSVPFFFGKTHDELARRIAYVRTWNAEYAAIPHDDFVTHMRDKMNTIVGYPDEVIPQLRAHADAGVEEIVLQWFNPGEIEALDTFVQEILPRV